MTPARIETSTAPEIFEVPAHSIDGAFVRRVSYIAWMGAAILFGVAIRSALRGAHSASSVGFWIGAVLLAGVGASGLRGLTLLAPGEAVVMLEFGRYAGTLRPSGQHWVKPWTSRRRVPVRIRTHETAVLKVNDNDAVPVEIAMAVSWQVSDTAKALFAVEDFVEYVKSQSERALRQVAAVHCYEEIAIDVLSTGTRTTSVADKLFSEVANRFEPAGITVIDCQIVRIAYAPEIAQAMLRRQQAAAIVAARQHIVEGAVGMVELALKNLGDRHVVDLDEERKATMVSNLLVVLCSDHPAQPMVNAGSLYL